MGTSTEFAASLGNLTKALDRHTQALTASAESTAKLVKETKELSDSVKETKDPFEDLLKVLNSQDISNGPWGDAFKKIIDDLKNSKISASEAREEMQKLIVKLEQLHDVDKTTGGPSFAQDLLQQLEKMIALLERAKRGG